MIESANSWVNSTYSITLKKLIKKDENGNHLWIDDEVINNYLDMICSAKYKKHVNLKIRALSTQFYSKLIGDNITADYDFHSVNMMTNKFDIFDQDIVIVPINKKISTGHLLYYS